MYNKEIVSEEDIETTEKLIKHLEEVIVIRKAINGLLKEDEIVAALLYETAKHVLRADIPVEKAVEGLIRFVRTMK